MSIDFYQHSTCQLHADAKLNSEHESLRPQVAADADGGCAAALAVAGFFDRLLHSGAGGNGCRPGAARVSAAGAWLWCLWGAVARTNQAADRSRLQGKEWELLLGDWVGVLK